MELTGPIGGEDHQRRGHGGDRADLGNRDLVIREKLEQERLEFVVGPVDLVDEQHRPVAFTNRRQQRALEQELGAEQLVDVVFIGEIAF